jgi:hypothetical protein
MAGSHGHWFKARIGFDFRQIARLNDLCDHTLAGDKAFCVPDTRQEPCFAKYPLIEGELDVRFYDRVPLVDSDGFKLGTLELDLRNALKYEELLLYYQPIINIRTGAILGFEALLRWQHRERGLVLPSEFVHIAEDAVLIVPIGAWVLERACQDASAWRQPLTVAVNLSGQQFKHGNLIGSVKRALEKSGLEASRLELEITETVLLEQANEPLIALKALRALGARIAGAGLQFDHQSGTGVALHMLSCLAIDGRFGLTAIGRSPAHAMELHDGTKDAMAGVTFSDLP